MADQDARDLTQINSAREDVPLRAHKKLGLLWVVLACVVVGVVMGIVVYQQSVKPKPVSKPSPKPTMTTATPIPTVVPSLAPSPSASLSAEPVQINMVQADFHEVTFPETGNLRVYYKDLNGGPSWKKVTIILTDEDEEEFEIVLPGGVVTETMQYVDSQIGVGAEESMQIGTVYGTDLTKMSLGWVAPTSGVCGQNGVTPLPVQTAIDWAKQKSGNKPMVSTQCWADYAASPTTTAANDFDDYLLIWSYVPTGGVPTPTPSGSKTPSPSPTKTPSPSPTKTASPSPTLVGASKTPTPSSSARVSMPDTTDGVPTTGIFEITVGTISVGLIFLVLGLVGLLMM